MLVGRWLAFNVAVFAMVRDLSEAQYPLGPDAVRAMQGAVSEGLVYPDDDIQVCFSS